MMLETTKKVLDIFKKEIDEDESNYCINVDDDKFQMFDYLDYANFTLDIVDDEKNAPICISFYSGCPLAFAAYLTKVLIKNGIDDFIISENVYLDFDEEGICQGMLFGDEADARYEEDIYKKIRDYRYKKFAFKKDEKVKNVEEPKKETEEEKPLG